MMFPKTKQPTHARWIQIDDNESFQDSSAANKSPKLEGNTKSIFTPVKPIYSRNLMIIDTVYESAPVSLSCSLNFNDDFLDIGLNGISRIPAEIKAELPPECLKSLEETLRIENQWKSRWGPESEFGHRRPPIINKGVV